jgi:hypothetical protein
MHPVERLLNCRQPLSDPPSVVGVSPEIGGGGAFLQTSEFDGFAIEVKETSGPQRGDGAGQ